MNPIFAEARNTVEGVWIMGIMTLAFLAFFIGWTLWAYWPSRKEIMREASLMPFDETLPQDAAESGVDR